MKDSNIFLIAVVFFIITCLIDFALTAGLVFIISIVLNVEFSIRMVLIAYVVFTLIKLILK